MAIQEVNDFDHSILKFQNKKGKAPDFHYFEWVAFMKNSSSKSLL